MTVRKWMKSVQIGNGDHIRKLQAKKEQIKFQNNLKTIKNTTNLVD